MNNQIISDSIKQNINAMIRKICNDYCAVEMLKNNKKLKRSIYNKIISKYNKLYTEYKDFSIKDCNFHSINKNRIKSNILNINIDQMIIETIGYSYDYLDDFYNEIYVDNLLCGLGIHQEVFEYFDDLYFNDFKNDFSSLFTLNFIKFKNDIINRNKNIILNILKNKKLSYLSEAIIDYY
jgi:hypothetical protein